MTSYRLTHVPDHDLLRNLDAIVERDRVTTAEMLAHIAEVDERRLYASAGYPSIFAYCTGHLRMSEDAAGKRIHAARAARELPAIFAMLADGRLHLSAVAMLASQLKDENPEALLAEAAHKTKAEIEELLVRRSPRPDLATRLEPLAPGTGAGASAAPVVEPRMFQPAGTASACIQHAPGHVASVVSQQVTSPTSPPAPPAKLSPLSPERFGLQVTIGRETRDKLRYAQALLGHAVPSGDVAQVLDRALDALVAALEKQKFAAGVRTRPGKLGQHANPRYVPAEVRREVWQRDGGRCTFESDKGHRCETRERLEFDHVTPVARGGTATAANLRLSCRTHNQHAAEQAFGAGFMKAKREHAKRRPVKDHDALRERRAALERERAAAAEAGHRNADVIPWLRQLGFRSDEARRAAAQCESIPDAPLEARVRHALRHLAPHVTRGFAPGTSGRA